MGLISIISNFLRTGTFDFLSALAYVLSATLVIFLVTPLHECAHAFAAYKLGDPTAKNMGRLSLNPFRHIDWIGAALIMAVGFGWASPVPVNSRNFKNPKGGMALTALAGPVSNILAAFVSIFLLYLTTFIQYSLAAASSVAALFTVLRQVFFFLARINISLAVFNLIPIPPLDGSRLLTALLPDRIYYKLMAYERYISFLLIAVVVFGLLDYPLSYLSTVIFKGLSAVAALPFGG
mgnify:FL=1